MCQHRTTQRRQGGGVVEGSAELGGAGMPSAIWAEEALMAKAECLLFASLVPNPASVKSTLFSSGIHFTPLYHVWSRWGARSGGRSWMKAQSAVTAYSVHTRVG